MEYHSRETWEKANKLEQSFIKSEEETMEKHTMVTIYKDPLTQKEAEGKACLLHRVCILDNGLEEWRVCFAGDDGAVYTRWVKSK